MYDIIVLGASAGGVEALMTVVAGLPADLPASLFVVVHIPADAPSALPQILARAGSLPATAARDGDAIVPGHIYVAPPDRHLLLTPTGLRVTRGPRENYHRPAVDVLFRTAALAFGPRVIGVILSGTLDDGTAGLQAVKRRGGLAVVQDPATALFAGMPTSACRYVATDVVAPLDEIAPVVAHLVATPAPQEDTPVDEELRWEADIAGLNPTVTTTDQHPGQPTSYTCPECYGPLWELHDGALVRYRCRVGHAFTSEAMLAGLTTTLEDALWLALNTMEARRHLLAQMADAAQAQHLDAAAQAFQAQRVAQQHQAQLVRQLLWESPPS